MNDTDAQILYSYVRSLGEEVAYLGGMVRDLRDLQPSRLERIAMACLQGQLAYGVSVMEAEYVRFAVGCAKALIKQLDEEIKEPK